MLTWSMKAPRNRSTAIIMMTTVRGVRSMAATWRSRPSVAPEFDRAWLNTREPAMMNRIIVLIFAVSSRDFAIARQLKSAPSIPEILIVELNTRKK